MNKRKKLDNVLYARTRKWAYERDNGQCVLWVRLHQKYTTLYLDRKWGYRI